MCLFPFHSTYIIIIIIIIIITDRNNKLCVTFELPIKGPLNFNYHKGSIKKNLNYELSITSRSSDNYHFTVDPMFSCHTRI